jgi:hypothetical protein
MFNTFERELIAAQYREDRLRAFAQRQLIAQATEGGQASGIIATLVARLRGTATAPRIASANTSRA